MFSDERAQDWKLLEETYKVEFNPRKRPVDIINFYCFNFFYFIFPDVVFLSFTQAWINNHIYYNIFAWSENK